MRAQAVTLEEIRRAGIEALSRELGPVGMVRFLQQFETGRGDYTRERRQWLADEGVQTLSQRVQERRKDTEMEQEE